MAVTPFTVAVSDEAIEDLHRRIDANRWPDEVNDEQWSYGSRLDYMKDLVNYWRHEYDWRAVEAKLNRFDHYLADIEGHSLHFIHQRSPHENATPMIITHGWPGSFVEHLDLVDLLTQPEKHGGKAEDACHVVIPSLPGYAWSQAAGEPGMNTRSMAKLQVALMAELGYDSYVAQGGDWGAMVTRHMADLDAEHCKAIHLNMVLAFPPKDVEDPMSLFTEAEKKSWDESQAFMNDGMGYFKIQGTRPQTLAYGLADSPVGLAGWLTEKFRAWTDCDGEIRNAISWDKLLTNISVYWFTNTISSSIRTYYEDSHHPDMVEHIAVPTGAAIYPKELVRPPKAWIESSYNLVHYYEAPAGGHFAAMEQPGYFAKDLRVFLAEIKSRGVI